MDFRVYKPDAPEMDQSYGQSRGALGNAYGPYSDKFRSCPKRFLTQTACVWLRAANEWILKRWIEASDGSTAPSWTSGPLITRGTKLEIILGLKRFIDLCSSADELLETYAGLVLMEERAHDPDVNRVLKNEMLMTNQESRTYYTSLINRNLGWQNASPEEEEEGGEDQSLMDHGELEDMLHLAGEILGLENPSNLTPEELAESFVEYIEQFLRTNDTPEENPLDHLEPEPELPESVPENVKKLLCCPITFEVFREPMIDPQGHTYEKVAILNHLRKTKASPITREKLEEKDLVPNRALKETIQALVENKVN